VSAPTGGAPLPGWIRWLGLPALAIALFGLFLALGFPYDVLARRIEFHTKRDLGTDIAIGSVRPYLGLGLGLRANDLMIQPPGSPRRYRIDSLALRPAWSFSWFRGVPALYMDVESPVGNLAGTAFVSTGEPGWSGELRGLTLDELPVEHLLGGLSLDAKIDADVDLVRGQTFEGRVDLRAGEGSVAFPGSPVAVPFDTLVGGIDFGGDHLARIETIDLEGPMLSGRLAGTIGHSPQSGAEPLALEGEVQVHQRDIQDMVRRFGIRVGRDGRAPLTIGGTLSSPRVAP